ncbi:hypothetical protein BBP40_005630, partial [Aspergillus hancockii]
MTVITCIARSAPHYETSGAVWTTFLSGSGWKPEGVILLTSLVSPNFIYAGIDGAVHLAEDCTNVATVVPRTLLSALFVNLTGVFCFIYVVL